MRSLMAATLAAAGSAIAHTGHGAPEGHLHWVGFEHVALLALIAGLLVYAARR